MRMVWGGGDSRGRGMSDGEAVALPLLMTLRWQVQ